MGGEVGISLDVDTVIRSRTQQHTCPGSIQKAGSTVVASTPPAAVTLRRTLDVAYPLPSALPPACAGVTESHIFTTHTHTHTAFLLYATPTNQHTKSTKRHDTPHHLPACTRTSVGLKHSPSPVVTAYCSSRPWSHALMNSFSFHTRLSMAPAVRELVLRKRPAAGLATVHRPSNPPST